jgi:hypothetical protein
MVYIGVFISQYKIGETIYVHLGIVGCDAQRQR